MKVMILQGLSQAYDNLVHMIAIFVPRFAVMLIIVVVGWLVALVLRYVFRAILHVSRLDRISEEAGASQVLRKAALPSISELLSRALFWVVWLGFMVLGVSVLGIPELHEQIARVFQLLPQIFIAILILFFGVLASNFLSRAALLASVNAGHRSPRVWSASVRFVILILAFSMALEQIGLANQTVISAFSIVFGTAMLALAIAFGLGGRHLARHALEQYFGSRKTEPDKGEEPSPL